MEIGALGPPPAALRDLRPDLPAAVLAASPAIRRGRDGALVAVPGLSYPDPLACAAFRLAFAPRGGPVLAGMCGDRGGGADVPRRG